MRLTTMAAAVAVLALGAGVALAACGSDDDGSGGSAYGGSGKTETTETRRAQDTTVERPSVATIAVRNGEPVGGVQELTYSAGDEVHFRVRSDVADEVHVHGYDISKNVAAGSTVAFSFPAELEGIFEVELEERAVQIAELRVEP